MNVRKIMTLFFFNSLLFSYYTFVKCNGIKKVDVKVNIRVREDKREFRYEEYTRTGNFGTSRFFILHYGYTCYKVVDGYFYTIWESSGNERAKEILVNEHGGPRMTAEIMLEDETKLIFVRDSYIFGWRRKESNPI